MAPQKPAPLGVEQQQARGDQEAPWRGSGEKGLPGPPLEPGRRRGGHRRLTVTAAHHRFRPGAGLGLPVSRETKKSEQAGTGAAESESGHPSHLAG